MSHETKEYYSLPASERSCPDPAGYANAIHLLTEVRRELHEMANELEKRGLLWAAQEIRIRHTPRIWQVVQKNLKHNDQGEARR